MSQTILKVLQKTISELINCEANEVTPGAKLVEDLGFESIDFLELSMTLSHEYEMEVDDKTMFLSEFRPLISNGDQDEALRNLAHAYPHLPQEELQGMIQDAPNGNVLSVGHLVRYVEYHGKGSSRAETLR